MLRGRGSGEANTGAIADASAYAYVCPHGRAIRHFHGHSVADGHANPGYSSADENRRDADSHAAPTGPGAEPNAQPIVRGHG